jgi:2-polyprenyl-6-methoxyphenol hydroxylase-like FAD-dependent oxidoreductase
VNTASRNIEMEVHGRNHAVVLGGSLAGLLTARVLSDHFEKVTLIERDTFLTTTETRRGIPQANHVHGLMPRGRQIMEGLFPGLQKEMISCGAPLLDMANDIAWLTPEGWGINFKSDLEILSFTRPLLDLRVRLRLKNNPRVCVMENAQVTGLVKGEKNRVGGVRIRDGSSNTLEQTADLIVDATGRASRAPEWLRSLGYDAPEETVVNAHIGYASRIYEIPDNFRSDWKCVILQAAPPAIKRGGLIFVVEGNRWLLTLIGGGRDYPPKDEDAFLEFTRNLQDPSIYEAVRRATALTPIKTHHGTENRLRQFDKLIDQPENFVVLGDAFCAFNPVYGQGMTIAAMGAMALDECLRQPKSVNFAISFHKKLAKVTEAPWMMATSQDYRYRETEGGALTLKNRFMHRYMDQILKLATFDTSVRCVLLQAFGMLVPPTALFRRSIVSKVVSYAITGQRFKSKTRRTPQRQVIYDTGGD